ncbi:MAG: iron-containing alcohol dehydrogenase [Deltaproteobacteria bacterium]|nr:iron-containing alcohol dehydrogenase [Deltaproteobacteria bacterium]
MNNFTYHNPVRIEFGRGTIARLGKLIARDRKVVLIYGKGSIKSNNVYQQVTRALEKHAVTEFSGVESNPEYETCLRAVAEIKKCKGDFLLAVGGGSVLDATKFIAAAAHFTGAQPWDLMEHKARIGSAMQLGCVITVPATGSEMNSSFVISRRSTGQKLPLSSTRVYPQFSILDPETTFTLSEAQLSNGIVDAMVHVLEQYVSKESKAALQDRQAEAVLLTLIERASAILANPPDYDARADFMWCSTNALNGLISCGVSEDWSTHMIGHELTALHGMDHGRTLAVVLPALWKHQIKVKTPRLAHYAKRVWGLDGEGRSEEELARMAIEKTEAFFERIGVATRLSRYNITAGQCQSIADRIDMLGFKLGEYGAIGGPEVKAILKLAE